MQAAYENRLKDEEFSQRLLLEQSAAGAASLSSEMQERAKREEADFRTNAAREADEEVLRHRREILERLERDREAVKLRVEAEQESSVSALRIEKIAFDRGLRLEIEKLKLQLDGEAQRKKSEFEL